MKRLLIFFVAIHSIHSAHTKTLTAQSYMFTRPIYQNVGAMYFEWREILTHRTQDTQFAARATPLFQESRCCPTTAKYFLTNCKSTLSIKGDLAVTTSGFNTARDIRAEWLNLPANFSGDFSIAPSQKQAGAMLSFNYNLASFSDFSFFKNLWLDISLPFVHVANELHPRQANIENPGTGGVNQPKNIIQAFNQPSFIYGRMSECKHSQGGLAEVRLGMGSTLLNTDDWLLLMYTSLDIPTHKRQKPYDVFGVTLGINGHLALTYGNALEVPLHPRGSDIKCNFVFLGEVHFLWHNHQLRTLDLFKKPYSRYLQLRREGEVETVPAVNLFTQCVKVHPHSLVDLFFGLRGAYHGFTMELGYKIWTHKAEKLYLTKPSCAKKEPEVTHFGIAGTGTNSASRSTIAVRAEDDVIFQRIKRSDFCLSSGASQGGYTQAVEGAVGYEFEKMFIGLGAFFEAPKTNFALPLWGIWGTIGGEF